MLITSNESRAYVDVFDESKIEDFESIEYWAYACCNSKIHLRAITDNDAENIELLEGKFDPSAYIQPSNLSIFKNNTYQINKDKAKQSIKHFDILTPKINTLLGEAALKRFNDYVIIDKSIKNIERTTLEKRDLVEKFAEQIFLVQAFKANQENQQAQVAPQEGNVDEQQPQQQPVQDKNLDFSKLVDKSKAAIMVGDLKLTSLEDIDTYLRDKKSILEEDASALLDLAIEESNFRDSYVRGLRDLIATNKLVYKTEVINGRIFVKKVDLRNLKFSFSDSEDIADCDFICHTTNYQFKDIIKRFGEELTDEEVDYLKNLSVTHDYKVENYEFDVLSKVKIITSYDENNVCKKRIETFKYKPTNNETAKQKYITKRYTCVVIENVIVLNVSQLDYLFLNVTELNANYSSYFGFVGDYGLIETVKNYLWLYDMNMYVLSETLRRAKTNGLTVDIAQIPKGDGWSYSTYFDMLFQGVNVIDSSRRDKQGSKSSFNQFQSYDLSLSQSIRLNFELMPIIDGLVDDALNISRQRRGDVQNRETFKGIQKGIERSAVATQFLTENHNLVKRYGLNKLFQVSCRVNKDKDYVKVYPKKTIRKIYNKNINPNNVGVYVTNDEQSQSQLEFIKDLSYKMFEGNRVSLQSLIEIFNTNSVTTAKIIALKEDSKFTEAQKEQQLAQIDQQTKELEFKLKEVNDKMKLEYEKLNTEKYRVDTTSNAQIQSARIQMSAKVTNSIDTEQVSNKDFITNVLKDNELELKKLELYNKEQHQKQQINNNQ